MDSRDIPTSGPGCQNARRELLPDSPRESGTLPEAVRQHLETCAPCRAHRAELEQQARLIASLPRRQPRSPSLSSYRAALAAWEERTDAALAREEQVLRPVLDLEHRVAPPGLRERVLARILRPSPRVLRLLGGATAAAAAAAILAAFLWASAGSQEPRRFGPPIAATVDVQVHSGEGLSGPERSILAGVLGTSVPALFEEPPR